MLETESEFGTVHRKFEEETRNVEKNNNFPYEIRKVEREINAKLLQDFTGERTGFVQVGIKKWFFPSGFKNQASDFYNFEVRPSDVWIITFPRSGTTWTQEMVWLLANNLNYEEAQKIPLTVRYPFLEFSCFVHPDTKDEFMKENKHSKVNCDLIEEISEPLCDYLKRLKERRFIKTHLPLSLLPKNLLNVGCKVIYVARNPKDVAVSYYHLNRSIRTQGYKGDFPEYWDYFKHNLQPWTPYWEHIFEAWEKRNEKNLLFMFYEDMNKNLKESIYKIQRFLGSNYNEDQLEGLKNHLNIDNFRKNSSVNFDVLKNHLNIDNFRKNSSVNFDVLKNLGILVDGEAEFVRKGKTGEWQDYFDEKLNEDADKWIENNLKNTDLKFPEI